MDEVIMPIMPAGSAQCCGALPGGTWHGGRGSAGALHMLCRRSLLPLGTAGGRWLGRSGLLERCHLCRSGSAWQHRHVRVCQWLGSVREVCCRAPGSQAAVRILPGPTLPHKLASCMALQTWVYSGCCLRGLQTLQQTSPKPVHLLCTSHVSPCHLHCMCFSPPVQCQDLICSASSDMMCASAHVTDTCSFQLSGHAHAKDWSCPGCRLPQTQTTASSWQCTWGSWTPPWRLRRRQAQRPSGGSWASCPWQSASSRCALTSHILDSVCMKCSAAGASLACAVAVSCMPSKWSEGVR